jgi:hypothetical protein
LDAVSSALADGVAAKKRTSKKNAFLIACLGQVADVVAARSSALPSDDISGIALQTLDLAGSDCDFLIGLAIVGSDYRGQQDVDGYFLVAFVLHCLFHGGDLAGVGLGRRENREPQCDDNGEASHFILAGDRRYRA